MSELRLKYFDSLPPAVSLAVLRTGFLFAASETGNHALYQFVVRPAGGAGLGRALRARNACVRARPGHKQNALALRSASMQPARAMLTARVLSPACPAHAALPPPGHRRGRR